VATDAQLGSAQLTRIARRGGLGLGRTGSVAHHGSGEIMIALSTTARAVRGEARPQGVAESALDSLFQATVEATEEAVMNALWRAETTTGRMGRVIERLPHEPVLELLESHGRLTG
jgi:D-aminopeptidase